MLALINVTFDYDVEKQPVYKPIVR